MPTSNVISTTLAALQAWPSLLFFLEFTLKSTLLMCLCLLLSLVLKKRASAHQHLLYSAFILILACLPFFLGIVPPLRLEILALPAGLTNTDTAATGSAFSAALATWWPPLLKLYLSGLLLLLLMNLYSLLRILTFSLQACVSSHAEATRIMQEILIDELADVEVCLKESDALCSPVSWGLLQPVIILPTEARHWSEDKLRHALLHELQHIQRLDWVNLLAGRFACLLFWYNPLIWMLNRKMSELAELACDDAVVLATRKHTDYAHNLVDIARQAAQPSRLRLLAQAMAASFLGSRVTAIMDGSLVRERNDNVLVIRSMLLAFVLLAVIASIKLAPAATSVETESAGPLLLTVNLAQKTWQVPEAESLVPADHPRLLLSINYPEQDTVLVRSRPVLPTAPENFKNPQISLEELQLLPVSHKPLLLRKSFPEYPAAARQRGTEGHILLEYGIDQSGRVHNPVVIEAVPEGIFEKSSLDAIADYQYDPPRINGKAVAIKGLRTRFVFQIETEP